MSQFAHKMSDRKLPNAHAQGEFWVVTQIPDSGGVILTLGRVIVTPVLYPAQSQNNSLSDHDSWYSHHDSCGLHNESS